VCALWFHNTVKSSCSHTSKRGAWEMCRVEERYKTRYRPMGYRGSQDNWHMKVVRLSALVHAAFSPRYPFLLETTEIGTCIVWVKGFVQAGSTACALSVVLHTALYLRYYYWKYVTMFSTCELIIAHCMEMKLDLLTGNRRRKVNS
jgi:hypothetical protein